MRTQVIAEIAQAHDGSLGLLYSLIDAAAEAKVDVVKFQMHIAEAESSVHEQFRVNFSQQDATRYDYWQRMEFTFEQWQDIKSYVESLGLEFMCSPFSCRAVDALERLGVKRYKIGSGEVNDPLILHKVISTKKPIILSSGMSNYEQLDIAVNLCKSNNIDVSLLQCTTEYPTLPENVGLHVINEMKERYNIPVGLSDHSSERVTSLAAVAIGAELIEVHLTFDKTMFGPDSSSSLTVSELTQLVQEIRYLERVLASSETKSADSRSEKYASMFGKSLAVNRDLKAGYKLTVDDLESKKPSGHGIPSTHFQHVVGKSLIRDIQKYDFIQEEDLND